MSYIDKLTYNHINPEFGELLKWEIVERLKNDMLFNEETTEVDVLSNFDVVTNKHKLLVAIDKTPLISLEVDANSDTFDTTWKVMNAYNKRFGEVND